MSADAIPQSPYVGLIPYSDLDAAFFFGRETETEIVSANLRSARLTVLYGTSGVGKSSVLQAGVVHSLREIARQDAETFGQAEFAVVIYRNWAGDPLEGIAEAVRAAVAESLGIKFKTLEPVPEKKDLTKILQAWSQRYGLELLIILDQFEELFNYLTDNENSFAATFARQLAQAANAPDLPARFLISLRGDTLSLLDYFKESIPGLFDNRLQINHLKEEDARRAITEPVRTYNDLYKPAAEFSVEPGLVDEVVEKVKIGEVERAIAEDSPLDTTDVAAAKLPTVKDPTQIYIETPYLQLVMKRIWLQEIQVGSNELRLNTLKNTLGGVAKIVQTHLDDVMKTLTEEEKQIAATCFKYLVTPMGTKIALTPDALANYTQWDEGQIRDVLDLLIKGKENVAGELNVAAPVLEQKTAVDIRQKEEPRILRVVEIPVGNKRIQGYQVTHDALIPAIQDWRARYVIEHDVFNQIKTKAWKYLLVGIGLFVILLFFIWRYNVNTKYAELQSQKITFEANENSLIRENDNLANEKIVVTDQLTAANDQIKISQTVEKQAKDDKNANYKALIPILINLSSGAAKERDTAINGLKLQIEQGKVPKEYENSIIQLVAKIDAQKAKDLRAAVADTNVRQQNLNQQVSPRVYIHITDEDQRATAQQFQNLLIDNNFLVPAIENVSGIKLSSTQIRYFRPTDDALASQVTQLLKNNGIGNVRTQYISGYEDSATVRPKQLELWFATDAFNGNVNSVKR